MTARFFRRPYPSANSVLLTGPRPVLVDTGDSSDVPALFAWLQAQGVPPGTLALVANTHWHVDHSGGNAALQAMGLPVAAEAREARALNGGEADACRARWLHQPCVRYGVDRLLQAGDVLETGLRRWTVLSLPGHTATQVGFWMRADGCWCAATPYTMRMWDGWTWMRTRPRRSRRRRRWSASRRWARGSCCRGTDRPSTTCPRH